MKTAAIIPCFNESQFIATVVKQAELYVDKVVVVDNGSYDGNGKIAKDNGAIVLYAHQKGMGASIAKGLKEVDADVYVTMDGDGQHNPNEIPNLIAPILAGNADMVVGVRKYNGTMPGYRKFGNNLIREVYNFNSPVKFVDVQCGFRAFNPKVKAIHVRSTGFGCVFELLVKARKRGCRILPVNVSCIYHESVRGNSTLNPLKHGFIVLCDAIRWRLWELFGT